ncbi:hypothetical protein ACFIJ5_18120 (plasmid) [Haloimpatiens sp. FM7330]|uniref:hypothetical protein n=1 Tax=Haloimpatiens sp. FM7330 TaxID=3298610 RepID=UPI0036301909
MKMRNILTALTLTAAIGVGGTAYAAASNNQTAAPTAQTQNANFNGNGIGLRRSINLRGRDIVESVAKDKYNISADEIANARLDGKTLYDLLQEKGINHDEFKTANIDAKNKAIDDAVAKGTITQEEGDQFKASVKENSANAVPGQGGMNGSKGNGQRAGRGNGNGRGMRNGGAN